MSFEQVEVLDTPKGNQRFYEKVLLGIEKAGNKLPDPVTLFLIFSGLVIILSGIVANAGVSVIHPSTGKTITAVNLMTVEGMQKLLTSIVSNFQGFPPLGLVLVVMLGVGVAEKSGLMEVAMKHSVTKVPISLVTAMIIFAGICANAAGDAGFIVLPPLAAVLYLAIGRNPLAGLFVAYASVAAGFSANILITMLDVLIASFTIPAAQVVDPQYQGTPAMNIYFIVVSTFILMFVGVYVNNKVIEPRLGKYHSSDVAHDVQEVSELQVKGLKWAVISVVLYLLVIVALCVGPKPFFADAASGSLLHWKAPLMMGIVPLIALMFLIPGIVYGLVTGSIKSDKDIVKMMGKSLSEMGPYIVLAFVAAQFLAYFNWSNMGLIIAVKGAEFLKNIGFTGYGLMLGFIVICSIINMFVGSASAKWAIMAPVFVPMFMLIGYDPSVTQMAFRIGDSITNPISPLFPYFPIIIAFARQYDEKIGMGTIIANMVPFSVAFGMVWTVLLVIFMLFNIPLGPECSIHYMIK